MTNDNEKLDVTPKWFWLVGGLFLLWNLMGVANYLGAAMATDESLAAQGYTLEQSEFLMAMPAYVIAVFALAVWGGLLASILFLLRKKWAETVFIFSGFMALLSFVLDVVGGSFKMLGTAYMIVMVIVVLLALFEVWFSVKMRARGILR